MFTRLIACVLVFALLPPLSAQSNSAAQVKATVSNIPIGGKLTIATNDGRELHGHLSSVDPDSFSVREVDLKTTVVLRYEEVRKVTKDYGRPGFGGHRVSPRKSMITGLALLGGLVVLIVLVASARD